MPQTNPSSASFKMDSKIKKITPSQLTGLRTQQDEYEEIDYSGKDLGQAVETMIKKTIQVKKKTKLEKLEDELKQLEPGTLEYRDKLLDIYIERAGGRNTREAVVAAARYLSEEEPDLPYFWGGKYLDIGVKPGWYSNRAITSPNSDVQFVGTYWPDGLDCSGFTGWALRQGGFNMRGLGTGSYENIGEKIPYNAENLKNAKPGDFLLRSGGHIAIITDIDYEKGTIKVAEEMDTAHGMTVTETTIDDFVRNRPSFNWVIDMDDYYANPDNTFDGVTKTILKEMNGIEITDDDIHKYFDQARSYDFTSVGCQTVYTYLVKQYGEEAANDFAQSIDHHVESGELINLAKQRFPDLDSSRLDQLVDQYIRIH